MKYFVICALAALVLIQAASGFKIRRVVYVVPVAPSTTTISPVARPKTTASTVTTTASTLTTTASTVTTTAAPPTVIYCSWKNNWCRPASNPMINCKWGICKYTG